jgi:hypothetical protein
MAVKYCWEEDTMLPALAGALAALCHRWLPMAGAMMEAACASELRSGWSILLTIQTLRKRKWPQFGGTGAIILGCP